MAEAPTLNAKLNHGLCLSQQTFGIREAAKGFLISYRASGGYADTYLQALEISLAFLAEYAEAQQWPSIPQITTAHIEDYLAYFRQRPRWFGERDKLGKPPSLSYLDTQYRRLNTFFGWLVKRGHIERNPLNLIPRPKIEERVIPTVSERELLNLLRLTDPALFSTPSARFRAFRDQAVLLVLADTPGRREEIATMSVNAVDIDQAQILVMGKGRRERWMPLGGAALEALWDYLQARARLAPWTDALWVDADGKAMHPDWLRKMLRRLGQRAGVPNLHPHRFRHTYAVTSLRNGMPERLLRIIGGWKKIPDTYFNTLGLEDAARVHRQISPADRLRQAQSVQRKRTRNANKPRGKL